MGRVGLVSLRAQLMGWKCWSSLFAGNLLAGWLEGLKQEGKGPEVLPGYGGPREWDVLPGGWLLAS